MISGQKGFGIKGIYVRWSAGHEQEDDPLRPSREVTAPTMQGVGRTRSVLAVRGGGLGREQVDQAEHSEATGRGAQELASARRIERGGEATAWHGQAPG